MLTLSTASTEYSIHRVQYPPSIASIQNCLSSLHSHDYELTPECSFNFWRASLQDRSPPASSPSELKRKVTSSHSCDCELTNWWIQFQHPACLLSTASKYSSNLALLWLPSASSKLLDHGLQVHLWVTWLWPPNAFPNSHDQGLQVHLWVTWSRSPSASLSSIDHGLPVHLQIHSITALKFISGWHDWGLQMHFQTRSITASKCNSELHDFGLEVHLETCSIMASKCITEFTRSLPPSESPNSLDHGLQVHL